MDENEVNFMPPKKCIEDVESQEEHKWGETNLASQFNIFDNFDSNEWN
jgi:hypothetical protein